MVDGSSSRRRVGPTEAVAAAVSCNPCITRRAWTSLLTSCWPRGRSPELLIPLLVLLAGLSITACLSSNPQVLPKICTVLPPSGITLHSVFGQSQTFQILTKHIGKTINNYETQYMQYENIFYDNSNNGYFIL
jgi:hypothetical protein